MHSVDLVVLHSSLPCLFLVAAKSTAEHQEAVAARYI